MREQLGGPLVAISASRWRDPQVMHTRRPILAILITLLTMCRSRDRRDDNQVESARLAAIIEKADRIVVFEHNLKDARVLFNSTARTDLEEFKDAAAIVWPPPGGFCLCLGFPSIRLYRGRSELLRIENHDWHKISCPFWIDDVSLKDARKWRAWFESRNIPHSIEEVARRDEARRDRNASGQQ